MNVYLRVKFQVSSVTLTSFRQEGVILPPLSPTSKQNPKKLTRIRVKAERSTSAFTYFDSISSLLISLELWQISGKSVCVSFLLRCSVLLCLFSFILGVLKSGTILGIVSLETLSVRWARRKYYYIFHIRDDYGLPLVLVR